MADFGLFTAVWRGSLELLAKIGGVEGGGGAAGVGVFAVGCRWPWCLEVGRDM